MPALAAGENRSRRALGVNQQSPSHSCEDRRCRPVWTLIRGFYSGLLLRTL